MSREVVGCEEIDCQAPASPLTPALSPLRGEGGREGKSERGTLSFSAKNVLRLLIVLVISLASSASAIIIGGRSNSPVRDAGWPEGALAVANLESRVGYWEGPPFGGGLWQFLYRGDTAAFARALTNFAAIRAPTLDLVIHDGPQENTFLKDEKDPKADTHVDWTFTVWVPANWHRLYNNPKMIFGANQREFRQPVDPPRLDVYVREGGVDWAKVEVPANLRVRDERSSTFGVDLSGGSVIRAEFYDMDTGKPVSGARLVVEKVWWQTDAPPHWERESFTHAMSDSSGRIRLDQIPTNMIRLSVTADGYAPRRLDQRAHIRPALLTFSVELAKTATISGIVTDAEGEPIKGAKVRPLEILASNGRGYDNGLHYESYEKSNVETDASGRFEIAGLPTGFIQLRAMATGLYFSDLRTIHDVPATNVVLRMTRAGGILINVIDKAGRPLSRFDGDPLIVEVEPRGDSKVGSWGGSATVKDDGTYEFTNVPPGEYRITSRPNPGSSNRQYAPEQIVTVKPGPPVEVKVVYE